MVANTATGDVRTVIEERFNTYLDRGYGDGGSDGSLLERVALLPNGDFFGGRSGMVGRTSTGMVRMVR
ncbi:MAG: hypothetical protein Ct9H300mP15_14120 [Gemmatimonadota bacterium]|nr:MAG: hypothetical protein Ct9H300mP15_14120 [Gemmatimonadota bacterium]